MQNRSPVRNATQAQVLVLPTGAVEGDSASDLVLEERSDIMVAPSGDYLAPPLIDVFLARTKKGIKTPTLPLEIPYPL